MILHTLSCTHIHSDSSSLPQAEQISTNSCFFLQTNLTCHLLQGNRKNLCSVVENFLPSSLTLSLSFSCSHLYPLSPPSQLPGFIIIYLLLLIERRKESLEEEEKM